MSDPDFGGPFSFTDPVRRPGRRAPFGVPRPPFAEPDPRGVIRDIMSRAGLTETVEVEAIALVPAVFEGPFGTEAGLAGVAVTITVPRFDELGREFCRGCGGYH